MVIAKNFGISYDFDTTAVPFFPASFLPPSPNSSLPFDPYLPSFLANQAGGEAVSVADLAEEVVEGAELEDSRRGLPVRIEWS